MKDQLVRKILHYNDEAPRQWLYAMKVAELKSYLNELRDQYPDDCASEPE